jgi:stage II sporulation protein D
MQAALDRLDKKNTGAFPVFDNGWKIYYGNYTSKSSASSDLSKVKSQFGTDTVVTSTDASLVKVMQDDSVEFVYASGEHEFYLSPLESVGSDPVVYYGSKGYRGGIGFKRYPDSVLTVINYINMDDYLYGVLPKEMSGDWPIEALKAQAVAARNYALINFGKHSDHGFDICATTDCQVYGGYDIEKPGSNQAVDETSGKLLKYNGQIVQTYYHSNSGGRTENIENIWSGTLPYIVGVYDPYSENAPNSDWELIYTKNEIESILSANGHNIGSLRDVRIEDVSENGRVQELVFKGSSGSATFIKEKARALFGYTTLKSMWFELGNKPMASVVSRSAFSRADLSSASYMTGDGLESAITSSFVVTDGSTTTNLSFSSDKIVFIGHGYGHGLGMSQWGAKAMAEQGYDFEEILTHYYSNTIVE